MVLEAGGVAEGYRRKLLGRSRRRAGNEVVAVGQLQLQGTNGNWIDIKQPRWITAPHARWILNGRAAGRFWRKGGHVCRQLRYEGRRGCVARRNAIPARVTAVACTSGTCGNRG